MSSSKNKFQIFLGRKIRAEREKRKISQEELGKKAKMHRTYIGMVERGEKNITIQNINKIAETLGVRVKDLIDF